MRYLIAMILAVVCALIATLFISSPVAHWVVGKFSFDSPDQVGELHSLVFMLSNIVGMLIGWTIGWAIGGSMAANDRPAPTKR